MKHDRSMSSSARIKLFTAFHLNLHFSSIEESSQKEVIDRCYWPLLDLAARGKNRVGIEATGSTLSLITQLEPGWIHEFRRLQEQERVELIGSGHSQVIAPLVPWRVNAANILHGQMVYEALLDTHPAILLVNEQAYSAALVDLAAENGFQAVIVEWENALRANPHEVGPFRSKCPQLVGPEGARLPVLWNSSLTFQKIQRLAHGESESADISQYLRSQAGEGQSYLCLYGGDAEVFDFRPGRYGTEAEIRTGEWEVIGRFFEELVDAEDFEFALPSEMIANEAFQSCSEIRPQSAEEPSPTKKQRKYNLTRWAVSGKGDNFLNTVCQRMHDDLRDVPLGDDRWRHLCELWSSDYRTHITQSRWEHLLSTIPTPGRLRRTHARTFEEQPIADSGRYVTLKNSTTEVTLDRLKGCSIFDCRFSADAHGPWFGGVSHATFEDVRWSADWFSGHLVFEAPGRHKVTDLDGRHAEVSIGETSVRCVVPTVLGPITKSISLLDEGPGLVVAFELDWDDLPVGSLRLGHVLLSPDVWDHGSLRYATHLGGRTAELFECGQRDFDHGEHVSFLVSASTCLGMTDGAVWIGDTERSIEVKVRHELVKSVGLISHRRLGDKTFFQFCSSILELDETSRDQKPSLLQPIEFEMTIRPSGPIEGSP